MQELSITQKFMLCVMNDKGRISGLDTDKFVCLVASGLLELYYENFITLEKKKVHVIKGLPAEKFYLKPLYDFLDQPSPVKLERIVEEYTLSDKKIKGIHPFSWPVSCRKRNGYRISSRLYGKETGLSSKKGESLYDY